MRIGKRSLLGKRGAGFSKRGLGLGSGTLFQARVLDIQALL